ncbi:MAG: type II toxin-antitoxin system Phd/YefM family antitoxin [Gammaproteobacteria bacterium]|nr:type II toxin-antitoxin system Phd/YefM family antitoxin [Gammaproteobacteria bacterium]
MHFHLVKNATLLYNTLNSTIKSTFMNIITANDLKLRGVSLLQKALQDEKEIGISVRGHAQFIVIKKAHYDYLRECEILAALAETQDDLINGRFVTESVEAHIKRIKT